MICANLGLFFGFVVWNVFVFVWCLVCVWVLGIVSCKLSVLVFLVGWICGFGRVDSVCWYGSFSLGLLTLMFGFGLVIWWVLIF